MISQTAEYALRAVTHLAYRAGTPQTAKQISDATLVPAPYLAKVLQGLARHGLIQSQRGFHGGFNLVPSPADLNVWQVIEAVDPIPRIRSCPLGIGTHGLNLCPLHRLLDDSMAAAEEALKSSTLEQIITTPSRSKPLCTTESS